jgi:hypothetical protein
MITHDGPDEKCGVILWHIRHAMVLHHTRLLVDEIVLRDVTLRGRPRARTGLR